MKYASKSTRGFYSPEIHGENIPADAVEISDEYHAELIDGQSQGKIIDWSGDMPVAVAPAAPTLAEYRTTLAVDINAERDRREEAGFLYQGKLLDSTPRSVQRITAARGCAACARPQPKDRCGCGDGRYRVDRDRHSGWLAGR